MNYEMLTFEMVEARYHSPMREDQMNESWLALRREMLRTRWAKARGLKAEDVGIAICPKSRKAYFQWKPALLCLSPSPHCTPNAPPRSTPGHP